MLLKFLSTRAIRAFGGVAVIVAAVGSSVALGSPAYAAPDYAVRRALPVQAGTELTFPGAHSGPFSSPDFNCTAGPVVRATGFLSMLSPYLRAVRYVVTAGHCASSVGQHVKVGETDIGTVSWISTQSDLALVRVEPPSTRRTQCDHTSGGFPRCGIVVTRQPGAVGRVITGYNRAGQEASLPVSGSGAPTPRELFCASGRSTGSNCTFESVANPPRSNAQAHTMIAESSDSNMATGDSGGPVYSRSGRIYGVLTDVGTLGRPGERLIGYVAITQFFAERSGYALVTGG